MKPIVHFLFALLLAGPLAAGGYHLPTPEGWRPERYEFPLVFAPSLPFRGHVELRAPPGMEDPRSEEVWSYALVWWLEGTPELTAESLERHLAAYFQGLARTLGKKGRALPDPRVHVRRVPSVGGTGRRFVGRLRATDDQFTRRRGNLTLRIDEVPCPEAGHTALFFRISPRKAGHRMWQELAEIRRGFRCGE